MTYASFLKRLTHARRGSGLSAAPTKTNARFQLFCLALLIVIVFILRGREGGGESVLDKGGGRAGGGGGGGRG